MARTRMGQHVGAVTGFSAVLGFLVRESSQASVVATIGAIEVAVKLVGEVTGDKVADFRHNGRVIELDPGLEVAGAGLNDRSRLKTGLRHLLEPGRVQVIDEYVRVFASRAKVNIISLGIHTLKPRYALGQLVAAPVPVHHPPSR